MSRLRAAESRLMADVRTAARGSGAVFHRCGLHRGRIFRWSNLSAADLRECRFSGADTCLRCLLMLADLRKSDLSAREPWRMPTWPARDWPGCDLRGAKLDSIHIDPIADQGEGVAADGVRFQKDRFLRCRPDAVSDLSHIDREQGRFFGRDFQRLTRDLTAGGREKYGRRVGERSMRVGIHRGRALIPR